MSDIQRGEPEINRLHGSDFHRDPSDPHRGLLILFTDLGRVELTVSRTAARDLLDAIRGFAAERR